MTQPNQSGGESETPRSKAAFAEAWRIKPKRGDLAALQHFRAEMAELERENAELRAMLKERSMGNGPIQDGCIRFIVTDGNSYSQVEVSNELAAAPVEHWAPFTIGNLLKAKERHDKTNPSARSAERA